MPRLRGLRELVHDAIDGITSLVEETHEAAAAKPVALLSRAASLAPAVRGVDEIRRATAATVFASVRAVNRGVQRIGDAVDRVAQPLVEQVEVELPAPVSRWLDGAQGGLNALIGDFLREQKNALALELAVFSDGRPLPLTPEALAERLPDATPKLCVFVHGLGCTEQHWKPPAELTETAAAGVRARVDYGQGLAAELGYTPLYVRYNSGLHISENGRALAQLIDALVASYPVPVQQIALIGHSMGGLVARSAAHYASAESLACRTLLRHVLCIGSPHLGTPLEKAGNALASILGAFDVAGTQVPAKILRARSAGIKDLRYGYTIDEEWTGRDPDAFLRDERQAIAFAPGIVYGYIAATSIEDPEHPLGTMLGDLLVRVPSASGAHSDQARHIPFHLGQVLHGIHHQALLTHPDVYAQLISFLGEH